MQHSPTACSGAAELAFGLGMFHPRTRKLSALGLFALTIAVFPANIDMAVNNVEPQLVEGRFSRSVGTATGPAQLDPPAAPAPAFVVALEGIPRCVRSDPLTAPVRA